MRKNHRSQILIRKLQEKNVFFWGYRTQPGLTSKLLFASLVIWGIPDTETEVKNIFSLCFPC